jgi:hypothetical protein
MTKEQFITNKLFHFIGSNSYNDCPKTKSEDDLYLVSLEYFGRYEDDDCNFLYMSSKDGSLHHDGWSTRGACPSFKSYLRMTVNDAVAAGYMPKEFVDNYIDDTWLRFKGTVIDDLTRYLTDLSEKVVNRGKTLNIPCTVSNRSRKYKGEGVLIRIARRRVYHPYYGNDYENVAKVLGTDGKIYTVSTNSVDINMETIKERLVKMIPTIEDTNEFYDIFPMVDLTDELAVAVDVDHAAQMDKWYSRKADKFPGLLEWCKKTKPELDPIALRNWAEKVYRKNNPLPEWY